MDKGRIAMEGTPKEVFAHYKELEEIGLSAPQVTYIMHELKEIYLRNLSRTLLIQITYQIIHLNPYKL